MKVKNPLCLALAISMILVVAPVSAQGTLFVNPPSIVDPDITTFTITVEVDSGVTNLWGYEFVLRYDTAVLTATLSTPSTDFPDISRNEIDDAQGLVWVAASLPMVATEGLDGPLTLVTIEFSVDAPGESTLDIDEDSVILISAAGGAITPTIADGYFSNLPPPVTHILTVDSNPISGINFTIDGIVHTTLWSDSLLEGTYTIVMPSTWTVGAEVYYFVHWEDGSLDPTRTISLTEDTTVTATYELYVPPLGWIEGHVTDANTGDALVGATVTASGVSVLTNAEGYYKIEIAPGTYTVTASMSGYYDDVVPDVTVTADATATVNFELEPLPPETGVINGTVTDINTGDPIVYATVTANGYSATTDANGQYTITDVAPGDYDVQASATGYESRSKSVTVTAGETITVDFALTPTPAMIDSLIALVDEFYDLGYIDEEGVKDGLRNKLIAAKAKIDRGQVRTAKNILGAFINHLKAQRGKHVSTEAADILIADAQFLINNL